MARLIKTLEPPKPNARLTALGSNAKSDKLARLTGEACASLPRLVIHGKTCASVLFPCMELCVCLNSNAPSSECRPIRQGTCTCNLRFLISERSHRRRNSAIPEFAGVQSQCE